MRMLECCIPEIDKNENHHYNPFVEHVCVNNLKEKLDNKTYFLKCLTDLLEFHGMEVTYAGDDNNGNDDDDGSDDDNTW